MKKTEFEELWSKIKYTDIFDNDKIRLYYENETGLTKIRLGKIIKKEGTMFTVHQDETFPRGKIHEEFVEIPEHRFWVVVYDGKIIFDRRKNYQGKKELIVE